MSDLRQRVFLQSLLFGCLLSALTLSIAHTFFGPRYGEAEDAEATPCWQSDANSEPALAVSGPETNLSSLDAEEQLRNLLSLLRCNDMDECIRHARLAGEVRDTYHRHILAQRRLTLQGAAGTAGAQESLRPRPSFQEAFADLNIVGLPKTGTTQLYEILASHPNVRRLNPNRKENCAVYPRTRRDVVLDAQNDLDKEKRKLQVNLHSFVQSMAATRSGHSSSPGAAPAITLNGCFSDASNIGLLRFSVWLPGWCVNFASVAFTWYYLRPTNRKFILMFRDPAEWLWSSWNFFDQQKHLDAEGLGRNGWVKKNYRSPELFHELLTSRSQTLGGQWLVSWRCRSLEDPRLLMRMVGRSSILFLRNEDLVPSRINLKGGLLEKVGGFLGISPQKFDPDTYSQIMNCNNKKGFKSKCDNLTTAYKVSGGRSLLPETRVVIYLQFWEQCNIWAVEFGIVYPDCLNVINFTAPA